MVIIWVASNTECGFVKDMPKTPFVFQDMVALGPNVTVHRMSFRSVSALQTEIASCRDDKELRDLGD
jgi:hypothetical protein